MTLDPTLHKCLFCGSDARREKVKENVSQYLIDCPTCGSYRISISRDQVMRSLPDQRWLQAMPKAIRTANARGMRLYVDDGSQSPLG